jgi:hypothetical protein
MRYTIGEMLNQHSSETETSPFFQKINMPDPADTEIIRERVTVQPSDSFQQALFKQAGKLLTPVIKSVRTRFPIGIEPVDEIETKNPGFIDDGLNVIGHYPQVNGAYQNRHICNLGGPIQKTSCQRMPASTDFVQQVCFCQRVNEYSGCYRDKSLMPPGGYFF